MLYKKLLLPFPPGDTTGGQAEKEGRIELRVMIRDAKTGEEEIG